MRQDCEMCTRNLLSLSLTQIHTNIHHLYTLAQDASQINTVSISAIKSYTLRFANYNTKIYVPLHACRNRSVFFLVAVLPRHIVATSFSIFCGNRLLSICTHGPRALSECPTTQLTIMQPRLNAAAWQARARRNRFKCAT